MSNLKPCPFCGSSNVTQNTTDHDCNAVECNVCCASGPAYWNVRNRKPAIEAWNKRTPPTCVSCKHWNGDPGRSITGHCGHLKSLTGYTGPDYGCILHEAE